jgi:hypothetical protein
MPVVIEVVAKLGDTRLDHDHIPPGSSYRIGSTVLVAKPGTHRIGLVEVTMERMFRVEMPVGHRPLAWRPLAFVLGSLVLHMTIWTIAMLTAPIEQLTAPIETKPRLVMRIDDHPDPAPKQKAAARTAPEASASAPAMKRRSHDGPMPTSADMAVSAAETVARVARSTPDVQKAMENVGPLYREDDGTAEGFGGHLWDIRNDPDFQTVKTGPGFDLSELADSAEIYDIGISKAEKARRKIEQQRKLAHKSAVRGDCVPAHRIAKWLPRLDAVAYRDIYLADPDIAYCLTQPVPPSFIKADPAEGLKTAMKPR